jgi:hypothetical protein
MAHQKFLWQHRRSLHGIIPVCILLYDVVLGGGICIGQEENLYQGLSILMDEEKALRLLIRQIKDVQAQADKVLGGENSPEAIESFSRYSVELKNFIEDNVASLEIRAYASELPTVEYYRVDVPFWQYLFLPAWCAHLYYDYQARNKAMEEIGIVRGMYATLEIMVRGLTN